MKDLPEISVAPMMDWTDRHCRYFHRLIAPHVRLYTEMITTGALLHGDRERFLRFDESEHPVALQLGGSEPEDLAYCADIVARSGYDEINLNCGCPSERVQKGAFGACLMKEPDLVSDCVRAMIGAVDIPVSVKCRIGIDEQDDFAFLDRFVSIVANAGCETFIIHARKAWLQGLSPKKNREVPPLDYERVAAIKNKYPELRIILNGGITDTGTILAQCDRLDGVMIGREAYSNPYFLAEIEQAVFGNEPLLNRDEIARKMVHYAQEQADKYGAPIKSITRHILGLYHHQAGAKAWKQALSTLPYEDGAGPEVIEAALEAKNKAVATQRTA
ncbi:MAG: tRNA dihydrouridine(20/20a) synthase DusA [Rhodospirillales bacterium]|nr:tRNA dihydrouridine(20/20a) synthase DusA [Alphaproteobacteria bacterium]MCB9981627.1 tRNA dihydrouridine(20/20a) synthase DusA [Rhodospirillales bacterium]